MIINQQVNSEKTSPRKSKVGSIGNSKKSIVCSTDNHRASMASTPSLTDKEIQFFGGTMSLQQQKRREQIIFKEMYQKALERGTINFDSKEDTEVMITAMKKKVRSSKEKEFIQSGISRIGVFANHPQIFQQESAKTQLFREIKFVSFKKRDVIFRQGDIGDTYYMIIKGEVFCLVPTFKNQEKVVDSQTKSKKKKNKGEIIIKEIQEQQYQYQPVIEYDPMPQLEDIEFLEKAFPNFKVVKVFKSWEGFGEIALITQQYRTATMVCKESSDIICLTKSGFDKIVGELARLSIPKSKLMSILMDIEVMTYAKDKVLFEEGQLISQVFFVLEGEVEISKKLRVEKAENNFLAAMEKQFQRENSMNMAFSTRNAGSTKRTICLSIIGANSYCGIDDLFNGKSVRHTTAKCISPTSIIYVLSKEKFLDSLRVYKQMERDNSSCVEKDKLMEKRSQDIASYIKNTVNNTNNQKLDYHTAPQSEQPIQPLMNPRDIIKQRVILSKEIIDNSNFKHGYRVFLQTQECQQLQSQQKKQVQSNQMQKIQQVDQDEVIGDNSQIYLGNTEKSPSSKSSKSSEFNSQTLIEKDHLNEKINKFDGSTFTGISNLESLNSNRSFRSRSNSPIENFSRSQILKQKLETQPIQFNGFLVNQTSMDRVGDSNLAKALSQSQQLSSFQSPDQSIHGGIEKKIDFIEQMNLVRIKRDCGEFLKNNSILKSILGSPSKKSNSNFGQPTNNSNMKTSISRLNSAAYMARCMNSTSLNSAFNNSGTSSPQPRVLSPSQQQSNSSLFLTLTRFKYLNEILKQKNSIKMISSKSSLIGSGKGWVSGQNESNISGGIIVQNSHMQANRRSKTSANFFESLFQKKQLKEEKSSQIMQGYFDKGILNSDLMSTSIQKVKKQSQINLSNNSSSKLEQWESSRLKEEQNLNQGVSSSLDKFIKQSRNNGYENKYTNPDKSLNFHSQHTRFKTIPGKICYTEQIEFNNKATSPTSTPLASPLIQPEFNSIKNNENIEGNEKKEMSLLNTENILTINKDCPSVSQIRLNLSLSKNLKKQNQNIFKRRNNLQDSHFII